VVLRAALLSGRHAISATRSFNCGTAAVERVSENRSCAACSPVDGKRIVLLPGPADTSAWPALALKCIALEVAFVAITAA